MQIHMFWIIGPLKSSEIIWNPRILHQNMRYMSLRLLILAVFLASQKQVVQEHRTPIGQDPTKSTSSPFSHVRIVPVFLGGVPPAETSSKTWRRVPAVCVKIETLRLTRFAKIRLKRADGTDIKMFWRYGNISNISQLISHGRKAPSKSGYIWMPISFASSSSSYHGPCWAGTSSKLVLNQGGNGWSGPHFIGETSGGLRLPKDTTWVCLKIWYIPNEISI